MRCDLKNFYINGYKGYINRASEIMYLDTADLERFQRLLEKSSDRPTCVVIHVPLAPIADRLHEGGIVDQTKLLQEIQLRSMVEACRNVKLVLSAHQHFNQVDVIHGQLHCITQRLPGFDNHGPAIRWVELTNDRIRSWLIWDRTDSEQPAPIGTVAGDRSFEWTIPI